MFRTLFGPGLGLGLGLVGPGLGLGLGLVALGLGLDLGLVSSGLGLGLGLVGMVSFNITGFRLYPFPVSTAQQNETCQNLTRPPL
jgi:hypothetical protein